MAATAFGCLGLGGTFTHIGFAACIAFARPEGEAHHHFGFSPSSTSAPGSGHSPVHDKPALLGGDATGELAPTWAGKAPGSVGIPPGFGGGGGGDFGDDGLGELAIELPLVDTCNSVSCLFPDGGRRVCFGWRADVKEMD